MKQKCRGIRNRAAVVRKRDFDENMLMSDYTLLEEVSRANAVSARVAASIAQPTSGSARSKRAMLIKEAARRNIHLHLMPEGFARRVRNTSHVRGRKDARSLYWHVDIVFAQPGRERRVHVDACPGATSIAALVLGARDALLNKRRRGVSRGGSAAPGALFANVPVERMDVYIVNEHVVNCGTSTADPVAARDGIGGGGHSIDHDIRGVYVPGKAIGQDNLHRYLLLNQSASLGQTLAHRVIVEFPILYVSLQGSAESSQIENAKAGFFEKPEQDSESDEDDDDDDDDSSCDSSNSAEDDKPTDPDSTRPSEAGDVIAGDRAEDIFVPTKRHRVDSKLAVDVAGASAKVSLTEDLNLSVRQVRASSTTAT
jgi:hypothetical protein